MLLYADIMYIKPSILCYGERQPEPERAISHLCQSRSQRDKVRHGLKERSRRIKVWISGSAVDTLKVGELKSAKQLPYGSIELIRDNVARHCRSTDRVRCHGSCMVHQT